MKDTHAVRATARRLVIFGSSADALLRLRGGLISACTARGGHVLALAPDVSPQAAARLAQLGALTATIALKPQRFTLRPRRKVLASLRATLADFNPQAVLATGADVVPYAVAAARAAGVTRLGVVMSDVPASLSRRLLKACSAADVIFAHNSEDARRLRDVLARTPARVVLVCGTGADLAIAPGCDMPRDGDPIVFLAASRLDRIKGVYDYLEAARLTVEAGLPARFRLAGWNGMDAGAVTAQTLAKYHNCVQYLGEPGDIASAVRDAHVFVCASHREGMPPNLLTALAAGRPIVASDIPGCRETVDDMINGTLSPPGDATQLAHAFARIVRHRSLLASMSRASRAKAERNFSNVAVHGSILNALELAA